MKALQPNNTAFLLGGTDHEMVRIAEALFVAGWEVCDKNLGWGAKASAYTKEISEAASQGKTIVLVELELDMELPENVVVVDHHGERSGEPASILQVLFLIGIEPTRQDLLVAANDSGWIPGLIAIGATAEEITAIRGGDRSAQGVTPEQEAEAVRALTAPAEYVGKTRVIRMAHSKCAPIGDTLAAEALVKGEEIPQYIVLSGDGECNFSGNGNVAQKLHETFQGWAGGSGLGDQNGNAYWGGYPNQSDVLEFLKNF